MPGHGDCDSAAMPGPGRSAAEAAGDSEGGCDGGSAALNSLPHCVLWRILMRLPLRHRAVASCVCREWGQLLASPQAWQDMAIGESDGDATVVEDGHLEAICGRAHHMLRTLRLLPPSGSRLRPSTVVAVCRSNTGLEELDACQLRFPWSGIQVETALSACASLSRLTCDAYMTGEPSDSTTSLLNSLATGRLTCARLHVAGRFRGESLTLLGSTLAGGAKLHRLECAFADIGDAAIAVLAPGVSACGLRELCLRGNSLTSVGATALAQAMAGSSCRIERLVLGSNAIGDGGATALAALLRENTTVTALDVSGNGITAPGAVCLAASLTRNSTLAHLNLDFNAVGPTGAAALAAALPHSGLVSLELEWNGIKDAGATTMAFALHAAPASRLRHLGLASNGIRAGGAILLAGALRGSSLHSLVLAGNSLGLGALTLAAAVRTAPSLRVLDVTACSVDADALLVFAASLADAQPPSSALTALRLGGNNPGGDMLTPFAQARATNGVLLELEFTVVVSAKDGEAAAAEGSPAAAVDVTLRREPGGHWRGAPSFRHAALAAL